MRLKCVQEADWPWRRNENWCDMIRYDRSSHKCWISSTYKVPYIIMPNLSWLILRFSVKVYQDTYILLYASSDSGIRTSLPYIREGTSEEVPSELPSHLNLSLWNKYFWPQSGWKILWKMLWLTNLLGYKYNNISSFKPFLFDVLS